VSVCVTETNERNFEQRCAIKLCVKLGEIGIETFNKLKQAYGEHVLSRSQVFKWYKAFSEGRESINLLKPELFFLILAHPVHKM